MLGFNGLNLAFPTGKARFLLLLLEEQDCVTNLLCLLLRLKSEQTFRHI